MVFHYDLPMHLKGVVREFHVAKKARDKYQLQDSLFSLRGNVLLANFSVAQELALKMNQARDSQRFPELAVSAGQLHAAGLLDEVLHLVLEVYRENMRAGLNSELLTTLATDLGASDSDSLLQGFVSLFPTSSVARGEESAEDYLGAMTDAVPNREIVIEELLMLYLANANPAMERLKDLIDDRELAEQSAYTDAISIAERYLAEQPPLVAGFNSLLEMLRAPSLANPTSLEGQLDFIRQHWLPVLGQRFAELFTRLLQGLDILKEEQKQVGPPGPAPTHILDFVTMGGEILSRRERHEYERFSPDRSWMPNVVMLAKSIYVWLDQLSKTYQRDISRLDQIPDEELDELTRRGFTGLWLIGLWERSEASKRIKHLRGQADAVASAYALYDYQIAADLGGDLAYENLRDRAWYRGIRLASDMVPNHVGLDGRWVIDHPDWFLQLDHSPYPGYSFNGPDLSSDERVGIFIEDHYYDNSDAAVVFKRLDRWTGEARYIYHGNDGTTMPWNDTAQLNYLSAELREAVIQTILHVARKFSIIRFDAAMTLAKQHIQRLWFPEPGHGGAIPSRAQYGSMRHEDFERAIPQEFWREVVDRVAQELPDTLLLAEAFWMMEGYFVRTLGMHRVYNSAFMNMLKKEENYKYRQSIKNVLEFDPDILKRFVNFMNNPDEETAVAQFGKDDKYFGVCLLMVTMPGLPMFGHGQIEGYTEKYGMEYRRAKFDEQPDQGLIDRHYREIFPLLHRRAEFAEVDYFLLYDLHSASGYVNEDVYAYSNRHADGATLVLYNNKFAHAEGWIRQSSPYKNKTTDQLSSQTVAEGLALVGAEQHYTRMKEQMTGLEYLMPSRKLQEEGLYVSLGAFKSRVYVDIREVFDQDGRYAALYEQIGTSGVPSLDEALTLLDLQALHRHLDTFLSVEKPQDAMIRSIYEEALRLAAPVTALNAQKLKAIRQALKKADQLGKKNPQVMPLLRLESLLRILVARQDIQMLISNLRLIQVLERHVKLADANRYARCLPLALHHAPAITLKTTAASLLKRLLNDERVIQHLEVNEHDGLKWFNHEAYQYLVETLTAVARSHGKVAARVLDSLNRELNEAEQRSGYQLTGLVPKAAVKAKAKTAAKAKSQTVKTTAKPPAVEKSSAKKSGRKISKANQQ